MTIKTWKRMEYNKILNEEYIDKNIRPFTAERAVFNGAVRECLMLYLKGRISQDFYYELIEDNPSDQLNEFLEGGLRDVLAYYVLSITIRTISATVTRFGYTQKENIDGTSSQALNNKIVQDSNYFKSIADGLLDDILPKMNVGEKNTNVGFNIRVVGE